MSFFSNLKNKKSLLFGLILFFSFLVVAPKPVQAQDFGLDQVRQTTNLGDRPLIEIVGNIINIFLGLLGIIALVLIIYGGYLIMTSGGNEEQVQDGKKVLINAVIGLAIILAAFGITNFVINALTDATGAGGPGGVGQASGPQFQTFSGSGALGEKVQDHFPERDQKGVKRNTKISVTFNFPIDPGSVLENTNDTCWDGNGTATSSDAVCDPDNDNQMEQPPYYGDCIQDGGANNKFKWEEDCDQISTSSVQISKTTSTDPNKKGVNLMKAAGMIAYEDASSQSQAKAKTFTFKTIDMLGSNLEKKWHTVTLTNNIKRKKTKQGGQQHMDLFSGVNSYYEWKFQTDTNFDFNPPEVTSVYPAKRDNKQQPRPKIFKNSIIQINFSEPVDPTMVQGQVTSSPGSFENIVFDNQAISDGISGEWKITNGYRTVEFIPDNKCGRNSCGDPMYCLNIDCKQGNKSCSQDMTTLVRTANLLNPNASWEAIPFSGVMDMAGNALDGDGDGDRKEQQNRHKPPQSNQPSQGFTQQETNPNNFHWDYTVKNEIDRRIPYIQKVNPMVDEDNIAPDTSQKIYFSMPMQYSSMSGIELTEHSTSTANKNKRPTIPGSGGKKLPSIWYGTNSINTTTGVIVKGNMTTGTITTVEHREFGPNDMDLFYITSVSTSVKGINQNCVYPGLGPDYNKSVCKVERNKNGGIKSKNGCVPAEMKAAKDSGCPYNFANKQGSKALPSLDKCRQELKTQISNF